MTPTNLFRFALFITALTIVTIVAASAGAAAGVPVVFTILGAYIVLGAAAVSVFGTLTWTLLRARAATPAA